MLVEIKAIAPQSGIDPALLAITCTFTELVARLLQPAIKSRVIGHYLFLADFPRRQVLDLLTLLFTSNIRIRT